MQTRGHRLSRAKGGGRRPLPSAVKKLRGNPGGRPLNKLEPQPTMGEPEMPADLSLVAQAEWKSIVPELQRIGVLSTLDGKALAAYCHCYARWFEAERDITRLGLILEEPVTDSEGEEIGSRYKRNPAVSISNEALKLMRAYLVEFGMTPSSRSRMKIEKPPEVDSFDSLIEKRLEAGKSVN
jgi:P27 family predicted phage terminase small subunit